MVPVDTASMPGNEEISRATEDFKTDVLPLSCKEAATLEALILPSGGTVIVDVTFTEPAESSTATKSSGTSTAAAMTRITESEKLARSVVSASKSLKDTAWMVMPNVTTSPNASSSASVEPGRVTESSVTGSGVAVAVVSGGLVVDTVAPGPAKVTWSAEMAHAPRESWPYLQVPAQSKFDGPVHAVQDESQGKQRPTETSKNSPVAHLDAGVTSSSPTHIFPGSARIVPSSGAPK
mmetsp:Transcript_92198/g.266071  ORF Transcript_92198/g.266071 Transcript_92198/m.266071 type:complete len:236 (-) Transcript_92198:349-1056(-)